MLVFELKPSTMSRFVCNFEKFKVKRYLECLWKDPGFFKLLINDVH